MHVYACVHKYPLKNIPRTHLNTCTCTHMHSCIHHTHVHIHPHIHSCTHHTHLHTCTLAHTHVLLYTHMHSCTYHTHAFLHTHVLLHTHVQACTTQSSVRTRAACDSCQPLALMLQSQQLRVSLGIFQIQNVSQMFQCPAGLKGVKEGCGKFYSPIIFH